VNLLDSIPQEATPKQGRIAQFRPEKDGYLLVADRSDNEPYIYDGKKGANEDIAEMTEIRINDLGAICDGSADKKQLP